MVVLVWMMKAQVVVPFLCSSGWLGIWQLSWLVDLLVSLAVGNLRREEGQRFSDDRMEYLYGIN